MRTTPWIACGPKCLFAAGPPNTIVMFEFWTVNWPSFPPLTQTCSVDERGFVSKGAICPFPVNRLTVPLIWKPTVGTGVPYVGQPIKSQVIFMPVSLMWWV